MGVYLIYFWVQLIFFMYHSILKELKTKKVITALAITFNFLYFLYLIYYGYKTFRAILVLESAIISIFLMHF